MHGFWTPYILNCVPDDPYSTQRAQDLDPQTRTLNPRPKPQHMHIDDKHRILMEWLTGAGMMASWDSSPMGLRLQPMRLGFRVQPLLQHQAKAVVEVTFSMQAHGGALPIEPPPLIV